MPDKKEEIKTENPNKETKSTAKAETKTTTKKTKSKTDAKKTEEKVESKKTETKSEATKEEAKTTTKKTGENHPLYLDMTKWSLRKVAFLTIVALGVLHLISAFLALFNLQSIVSGIQAVASAVATAIVAVLSWSYAAERNKEWKIIYFICLTVVIVGIILPLVF